MRPLLRTRPFPERAPFASAKDSLPGNARRLRCSGSLSRSKAEGLRPRSHSGPENAPRLAFLSLVLPRGFHGSLRPANPSGTFRIFRESLCPAAAAPPENAGTPRACQPGA